MTLNADISALVERLRPHNTLDPPLGYWITSDRGGDEGHGLDYCEVCGDEYVMRLNLYAPGPLIYEMICEDSAAEHDSIPHCYDCGKTLAGWPSNYCRSEELAFFEDESDFEPNPENIHVICMVLWNLQWGEDEDLAVWRAVGGSLLAKIEALKIVRDLTDMGVEM